MLMTFALIRIASLYPAAIKMPDWRIFSRGPCGSNSSHLTLLASENSSSRLLLEERKTWLERGIHRNARVIGSAGKRQNGKKAKNEVNCSSF